MAKDDSPPITSTVSVPPYMLVVQDTFREFKRGDIIADPATISEILDTHHESFVVKIPRTTSLHESFIAK